MPADTTKQLENLILKYLENYGEERLPALNALYTGQLNPEAACGAYNPERSETAAALASASKQMEALCARDALLLNAFSDYRDAQYKLSGIDAFEQYANGFSLAVKLCVEVFLHI